MKIEFLGTPCAGSFHTSPSTDMLTPHATSPDTYQGPRAPDLAAQASHAVNTVDGWMVRAELFIASFHNKVVGVADRLSNTATGFLEGLRVMLHQVTQRIMDAVGVVVGKNP